MRTIHPGRLEGRLRAPSSKSYTHRAFILAALSGNGLVRQPLRSDDTDATLEGLKALGFMVVHESEGTRVGGRLRTPKRPIDARASGTTLRLLTGTATLVDGPTSLTGSPRLAQRPLTPLLDALRALGVSSKASTGLPITVQGPLQGGACSIPGDASSQFLSSLLLATPLAKKATRIELTTPLVSRPYVDVTLAVMKHHHLRAEEEKSAFVVPADQVVKQRPFDVPGDYSSAALLLCAAAASRGRLQVDGLRIEDPQGDRVILDHLRRFGANVDHVGDTVTVEADGLQGVDVGVGATPDLFPALCVLGAVARGTTRLTGAPHLRLKESDRVAAMADNLRRFGIQVQERPDGIEITGGTPRGALIAAHDDHRVAMAGVGLALASQGPSTLDAPDVVTKSYPGFWDDLARIAPGVLA